MGRTICRRLLIFTAVLILATAARAQSTASPTATPPDAPMPSFASLFTKLPTDLQRIPTISNAIWLGSTGALALAVRPGDRTMAEEAQESLALEEVLDVGEPLGSGLVQGSAALGTYLFGRFSHRADVAIVGADLVRAQIISGALTQGVKAVARRDRPDGGRSNSFPSGHSASSFATATVLQRHFGWRASMPAYALATYIAAARLSENQHFLSDVVFGAGIGIVSGRAVTVGRGTHAFAVAPIAAPGEIGITFTKVNARGATGR